MPLERSAIFGSRAPRTQRAFGTGGLGGFVLIVSTGARVVPPPQLFSCRTYKEVPGRIIGKGFFGEDTLLPPRASLGFLQRGHVGSDFEVRAEQKVLDAAIATIGHSRLDIAVGIGVVVIDHLREQFSLIDGARGYLRRCDHFMFRIYNSMRLVPQLRFARTLASHGSIRIGGRDKSAVGWGRLRYLQIVQPLLQTMIALA